MYFFLFFVFFLCLFVFLGWDKISVGQIQPPQRGPEGLFAHFLGDRDWVK